MTTGSAKHRSSAVRRVVVPVLSIAIVALATSCGSSNINGTSSRTTNGTDSANANVTGNSAAVSALLKQGLSQAEAKQLDQAETTFKNVLLLDPHNVYALYNLGVIDQTQNNTAGAISYYDQALSAKSTYTPAMYNKAIILEASDLDAALAAVQADCRYKPKRFDRLPADGFRIRQARRGPKS